MSDFGFRDQPSGASCSDEDSWCWGWRLDSLNHQTLKTESSLEPPRPQPQYFKAIDGPQEMQQRSWVRDTNPHNRNTILGIIVRIEIVQTEYPFGTWELDASLLPKLAHKHVATQIVVEFMVYCTRLNLSQENLTYKP